VSSGIEQGRNGICLLTPVWVEKPAPINPVWMVNHPQLLKKPKKNREKYAKPHDSEESAEFRSGGDGGVFDGRLRAA
jgi:hypothetical protein